MVSAKTTSVKQLRKELKYAKEQLKKAKQKLGSAEKGTKAVLMGKVISSSPLIVHANILDNSYYWITNPSDVSSDANYLGSFNGILRKSGTYRNYNNITCAEASWVDIPDKLYNDVKKWNKKVNKLKQPFEDRIYFGGGRSCRVGEKIKLKYSWLHSGKYNKLKWKSENKKIATVDSRGVVTAKRSGTTYIAATCSLSKITKRCKIKVLNKIVNITNITFAQTSFEAKPGETIDLGITKYPSDADEKYFITCKPNATSNSCADIEIENNKLYIHNESFEQYKICGNYTIVVTSASGKKWSVNLTIPEPEVEVYLGNYSGYVNYSDEFYQDGEERPEGIGEKKNYYLGLENKNIDINASYSGEDWSRYQNILYVDEIKDLFFILCFWNESKSVTYSIDNNEIAEITDTSISYSHNLFSVGRVLIKGKKPGKCNLIVSSFGNEKYRLAICVGSKPEETKENL